MTSISTAPSSTVDLGRIETVVIANDSAEVNGGVARVAIAEALELTALGKRVIYFAATGAVDPDLAASGVEVVCLDQPDILGDPNRRSAALRGLWNRDAKKALHRILTGLDPTRSALHAHSFSRGLSPSLGSLLTHGPIAAVLTLHDYFAACPNGGFYDYQREEICNRRPLSLGCLSRNCDARSRHHKAYRIARQTVLKHAAGIPRGLTDIGYISRTQLGALRPYLPETARLHYIPNPVERSEGPRIRAENNAAFVFVGRLSPEKGPRLFAQAAQAAGHKPVFVGDGPERQAVMAACPGADVRGWLPRDQVADILSTARALVFPSLWREPYGLVVAEALARGVPCLVGRWTAAADIVAHNVDGIVVDGRSPADWASAMKLITPRNAERMSRNAFGKRDTYGVTPRNHAQHALSAMTSALERRG